MMFNLRQREITRQKRPRNTGPEGGLSRRVLETTGVQQEIRNLSDERQLGVEFQRSQQGLQREPLIAQQGPI